LPPRAVPCAGRQAGPGARRAALEHRTAKLSVGSNNPASRQTARSILTLSVRGRKSSSCRAGRGLRDRGRARAGRRAAQADKALSARDRRQPAGIRLALPAQPMPVYGSPYGIGHRVAMRGGTSAHNAAIAPCIPTPSIAAPPTAAGLRCGAPHPRLDTELAASGANRPTPGSVCRSLGA
jgi:hypothetical protein